MAATLEPQTTILRVVEDPRLMGLRPSPYQRTVPKLLYGLALDEGERAIAEAATGRRTFPAAGFRQALILAGSRAGKDSHVAAPIMVYEALFGRHERQLRRGERGLLALVAQDREAAQIAFGYIHGCSRARCSFAPRWPRSGSRVSR